MATNQYGTSVSLGRPFCFIKYTSILEKYMETNLFFYKFIWEIEVWFEFLELLIICMLKSLFVY